MDVNNTATTASAKRSFGEEFRLCWERLPHKGFLICLLAAWALLFHVFGQQFSIYGPSNSLFQWMINAYNDPGVDASHGKLVPVAVLVLLWMRRDLWVREIQGVWWPGLVLLGVALGMHFIGYLAEIHRVSVAALFCGIYALVGLAWGWRTLKATFFPFVLFLFSIPLGMGMEPVTLWLRILSVKITYFITHVLLGVAMTQRGTVLTGADGQSYDVAAACSGIHSIEALLAITLIYAVMAFRPWWKRASIIALAIPLAVVCNVLRLNVLILSSTAFGRHAGELVHEWFGYLTYAIALGGVFLAARFLERLRPSPSP